MLMMRAALQIKAKQYKSQAVFLLKSHCLDRDGDLLTIQILSLITEVQMLSLKLDFYKVRMDIALYIQ